MIVIPGFEIQEQLNETEYTLVFRGIRLADNLPVIIKVLKNQYPSVEELAYYKGKYEMNLSLKIDGVTKVFGFESYLNTWMILEEDFGGDSLDKILSERKLDIPQILKLAISIITILGQLHRKRIIYKDLNPSKIIWNTETDQLKLINLGIFTSLSKEQTTFLSPNMLEE